MGRSFPLVVLWPGWLDHEAVQMAAPAAHPGRRAGRHHRTLPLYIDRTLRVELDAATDRGPAVRARYPRPDATIVAGHPQPRRPKADADKLPATDVSSLATLHHVHDRTDRRRGRRIAAVGLQRQDCAACRGHRRLMCRGAQLVQ